MKLVLICVSIVPVFLFSQLADEGFDPSGSILPKSPEAASIIKFEDVPVSKYTGIPSISVPLVGLSEKSLELSLKLDYHAGGHKVNDDATQVGLGWKLSGGGMITRKINGLADDADVGLGFLKFREQYSYSEDYDNDGGPYVKDWLYDYDETKAQSLSSGCWDSQPDIFYFNMNGYSGKFAFDWQNGSDPIVSCDQEVKIVDYTFDYSNGRQRLNSWVLVDPNGVKYTFATHEFTSVYNMFSFTSPCNSGYYTYISGWYLTKMESPYSNHAIQFEYDNYGLNKDWTGFETVTHNMSYNPECSGSYAGTSSFSQSRVDISGKVLKQVTTTSGNFSIDFIRTTQRTDVNQTFNSSFPLYALDEIQKKDQHGEIIQKVKLHYRTSGRLRLDSVQSFGYENGVESSLPPYKFKYNYKTLPSVLSKSVDHWGYYNGSSNNSVIPTHLWYTIAGTYVYNGSDRDVHEEFTKADVLEEVTYPQGAVVKFEYESNTYSYIQSQELSVLEQFETVDEFTGVSVSNSQSGSTPNIASEEFEIFENQTPVRFNIEGHTWCTFACVNRMPEIEVHKLNDDGSEELVFRQILGPHDAELDYAVDQTFVHDKVLAAGVYRIRAKAWKTSSPQNVAGDAIEGHASWTGINPAAPLVEKAAGGLRVKKITTYQADESIANTRLFEYDLDGKSSGVIYSEPMYGYTSSNLSSNGTECQYYQVVGSSRFTLGNTQGSHIGYQKVTEIIGENAQGGKTEYFFTSPRQHGDGINLEKPYAQPISNSHKTGLLTDKIQFKNTNAGFAKVRKEHFEYEYKTISIPAAKVSYGRIAPPLYSGGLSQMLLLGSTYASYPFWEKFAWSYHPLRFGHVQQTQNQVTHYFSATDSLVQTEDFTFNDALTLMTEKTLENSDGVLHIEKFKYSSQYNTSGSLNSWKAVAIRSLKDKNIVKPIETLAMIEENGTSKVVDGKFVLYKNFSGNPMPYKIHKLETNAPIINFEPSNIQGGSLAYNSNYVEKYQFTSYDYKGNLRIFKPAFGENNGFIWDQSKWAPVAQILGSSASQVGYNGFESIEGQGGFGFTENPSTAFAHTGEFSHDLNDHPISKTLTVSGYYKLHMQSKNLNAQVKINGQLIENLNSTQGYVSAVFYAESSDQFTLVGQGLIDEIRLHPVESQIKSYTYNSKWQPTSETDQNIVSNKFAYDGFERLIAIYDNDNNLLEAFTYHYKNEYGLNHTEKLSLLKPGYTLSDLSDLSTIAEEDYLRSVLYTDNLGRDLQLIEVGSSPSEKDQITIYEYDEFGKKTKDYLPFTWTSQNGAMHTATLNKLNFFYGNVQGAYAYKEVQYDGSPLNKIVAIGHPGENFKLGGGHEVTTIERSNDENEIFLFNENGIIGYYPKGSLYALETTDEDGIVSIQYLDKLNREIATKQNNRWTYSVYDKLGRMVAKLPPKAVNMLSGDPLLGLSEDPIVDMIYSYKHDQRNRIVEKNIPGQNAEKCYYNNRDQQIMRIDANGNKIITKYDRVGRVICTGLYHGAALPGSTANYEVLQNNAIGYSLNNSFPTSNFEILTLTYYDDYDFNNDGTISNEEEAINQNYSFRTAGLKTGLKEQAVGIGTLLSTRSYYDNRGRIIQTISDDLSGGNVIVNNQYNFAGWLENKETIQEFGEDIRLLKEYEYDQIGRLLKTYHTINNGSRKLVEEKKYNERNQLKSRSFGIGAGQKETIKYAYTIRGWLKRIYQTGNCQVEAEGTTLSGGLGGNVSFGQGEVLSADATGNEPLINLTYGFDENYTNLNMEPKYNGNVSSVQWQYGCGTKKAYKFIYDEYDQLKLARYAEKTGNNYQYKDPFQVSNIQYDLNGNITRIQRNDENGDLMDDLTINVSNQDQLLTVHESANGNVGFKASTPLEMYEYDDGGNMTRDGHKNMDLNYNFMNLPTTISNDNGDSLKFIYSATGAKLAKGRKAAGSSVWNYRYYLGNFEYEADELKQISFDQGRIVKENSGFLYQYAIQDNLANTRLLISDLNGDGQIVESDGEILQKNDYYPFGMIHKGSTNSADNKYLFNNKELNSEFGLELYDYQARWYDPALARWTSVDPLAEKFTSWSAFSYVMNSPLRYNDLDGMQPNAIFEEQEDGSFKLVEGDPEKDFTFTFKYKDGRQMIWYRDGRPSTWITPEPSETSYREIKVGAGAGVYNKKGETILGVSGNINEETVERQRINVSTKNHNVSLNGEGVGTYSVAQKPDMLKLDAGYFEADLGYSVTMNTDGEATVNLLYSAGPKVGKMVKGNGAQAGIKYNGVTQVMGDDPGKSSGNVEIYGKAGVCGYIVKGHVNFTTEKVTIYRNQTVQSSDTAPEGFHKQPAPAEGISNKKCRMY